MTTILIARPEAEGRQTAAKLQAKGFDTILAPALEITSIEAAWPEGAYDGVLVTSVHATPWIAKQTALSRAVPVFAVGEKTAAALRAAGFTDVRAAAGDRIALAALVRGAMKKDASLLAPVGRDHHADVPDSLRADGFKVASPVVYVANIVGSLPAEALAALRYDVPDAVLHYSARSATAFVTLLQKADIDPASLHLRHICLSQQVADALPTTLRAQAIVAPQPDEDALLSTLEQTLAGAAGASRPPKKTKGRARAFAIDGKATEQVSDKPAHEQDKLANQSAGTDVFISAEAPKDAAQIMQEHAGEASKQPSPDRQVDQQSEPEPPVQTVIADKAPMIAQETPSAAPSASAVPARRQRIALPLIAAGLLGGVAGGAAALFAPSYLPEGWLPRSKGPEPAALVANQVKTQLKTEMDARAASLATRSDVDALKQAVATAASQQAQPIAALQKSLADVGAKLAEVEKMARSAPDLAASAQKQVSELTKRIDLLDGVAKVPYDIVGLSKRVDDIAARKPEAAPDLSPIDRELAAANAAIADLRAQLAALAAKPPVDTARNVRLHALASGIASALQRGTPFKTELDAAIAAGAPPAVTQPLLPFADKGAPTGAALAKRFETVAPSILQAVQPPAPANPGFMDRVRLMASSVVRVRPVGQNAGDTPAGQVARIEAALPRGAFGEAVAAWQALPQAGQAASAEFGTALKARADAEAAGRSFVDDATRALARQGQ